VDKQHCTGKIGNHLVDEALNRFFGEVMQCCSSGGELMGPM